MSFRQELANDTVESLQLREAILIQPNTLVRAAIAMMRSQSLGCAVIVDFDRRLTGIFTEHSVIGLLDENVSLDESAVLNYAEPNFIQVKRTDPIIRVWDAVQRSAARFVCVTDNDGKVIGITGQRGLAEYLAECFARQVTAQRLGSTPWMEQREGA